MNWANLDNIVKILFCHRALEVRTHSGGSPRRCWFVKRSFKPLLALPRPFVSLWLQQLFCQRNVVWNLFWHIHLHPPVIIIIITYVKCVSMCAHIFILYIYYIIFAITYWTSFSLCGQKYIRFSRFRGLWTFRRGKEWNFDVKISFARCSGSSSSIVPQRMRRAHWGYIQSGFVNNT